MNNTIGDGIEDTQDHYLGEKNFENYGYGIGFSLLILVILILITYSSYLYIGKRSSTNNSSSHNIVNNNITNTSIVENQLVFIQQGLDETTLRNYPKLLYSQAKSHNKRDFLMSSGCSICLVDYKDNDKLRLLPDCHHIFHVKCIDPWLRLHPTCPNCRSSPFPSPLPTPLAEVVPLATTRPS
ncbi:RING-H2 finger protein ATL70-like [Solanum pennellii]|uniref:RING-H2 finger protein ATL70-like n=1 Tax=Solanum pennellii TaxID=28526 RepID=A0ABM1VBM1_SOLPN|nr:RING-H2 finger protein ATL70-like [Solanum pennellii]